MEKKFVNLLKKVERKSGDNTAYIKFFSDYSGALFIHGNENFVFDNEEELEERLNNYLMYNYI